MEGRKIENDKQDEFLEFMFRSDRAAANVWMDEWVKSHSYKQAVSDILEPVLAEFGKKWATEGGYSLAQGYIVGKIAEDILTKASVETAQPITQNIKSPVVIGNIEDDYHSLGRKLVVTFLRASGWEVHDMGNDVVAADLIDKAVEVGARVVGASAMMYTTAMNIKMLRNEIDRREMTGKIKLAVGGAVFVLRPELVVEVGGDGTARSALEAPEVFDQLLRQADK